MIMSLLTERSARKHVTETRKRTKPAVFRPELQREEAQRGVSEELWKDFWRQKNESDQKTRKPTTRAAHPLIRQEANSAGVE